MFNRTLAAALGLVLAGSLAAAVPSYADEPLAPPVIVSTGPHDQSTEVTITATSAAPYIQFRLFNGTGDYHVREVHSPLIAPNADGKFVASIPARGLNAQHQVYALNCANAEASSCEKESATAFVYHVRQPGLLNPGTQYLHPAHHDAQAVVPDLAGEQQVWLAAGSERVPAVAGAQSLDISTLKDGTYSFGLQRCSELNPQVCDSPKGAAVVVRRTLTLSIFPTSGPLLSQNLDGYWEKTTYQVFADSDFPASIRWRITKDSKTVIGPVALTPAETSTARTSGLDLELDPRSILGRQLPSGDYRFDLEVATTRNGYRWSTRRTEPLHVANSAPIRDLQVDRSVIYPRNDLDGFKTTVRLTHRFERRELKYGGIAYRIVRADGSRLHEGIWMLGTGKTVATWDGMYPDRHGLYRLAPEGRYRFELWMPNAIGGTDHLRSASFAVSHRKRVLVRSFRAMTAQRTLVRKVKEERGRIVRAAAGALHYVGTHDWPSADLRTMHAVRLPADRRPSPLLKIRGAWRYTHESPGVTLIGPNGGRREISSWEHYDTRQKSFSVPERFVWPNGELRFVVRSDAAGRVGLGQVVVRYWHYRWID